MSWKDDKDLGPWAFTEKQDVWGYLNNPRWSSLRKAVEFSEAVGNPIDPTNTHKPCGHWHKHSGDEAITVTKTIPTPDINIGSEYWWQPNVDVNNGKISIFPIRQGEGDDVDGVLCLVYDIDTATWKMLGYEKALIIYGMPNTGKSTDTYSAYYCTCSDYDDADIYYGRLYVFEEGRSPRYINVWTSNYSTGTPYEIYSSAIYNKMDCVGDRLACTTLEIERDGVAYDKWNVKFSKDAGLTFPNEFSLPYTEVWASGAASDFELRMSEDGILWGCYVSYTKTTSVVELWKSNSEFTSMSLVWSKDYSVDTGLNYAYLGGDWDVSNEDGQYISISLIKSGSGYPRILYTSDDYGVNFTTKTINLANEYVYDMLTAEKRNITVIAKNISLNKYGFVRSTDHGDNFSWLVAVIKYGGLTNHYIDVVNKTYINNNTIMCNRQGIVGATVGNSRIFTADPSPDVSHSYQDMQKHFNEIVYIECGTSYTGGDYQDLLYSDDNGATWRIIESPVNIINLVEDVEDVIFSSTVVTTTELNEPQVWQI